MYEETKDETDEDWTALYRASLELTDELDQALDEIWKEHRGEFETGDREQQTFTIQQTECYNKYVQRCEQLLEEFLDKEDVTLEAFLEECEQTYHEKAVCGLFEEDINMWFVEMLLGMTEFEKFHELMVSKNRRKHTKK